MLKVGDTGSFIELNVMDNPNNLELLYIPGVEALLARAEELKGSQVTEHEEQRIRNEAQVIATNKKVAEKTIQERGYI
jgi:hypothetical protein